MWGQDPSPGSGGADCAAAVTGNLATLYIQVKPGVYLRSGTHRIAGIPINMRDSGAPGCCGAPLPITSGSTGMARRTIAVYTTSDDKGIRNRRATARWREQIGSAVE